MMTTSVGNSQNTECDKRPDKIISKERIESKNKKITEMKNLVT